jgi:hypothetical protein
VAGFVNASRVTVAAVICGCFLAGAAPVDAAEVTAELPPSGSGRLRALASVGGAIGGVGGYQGHGLGFLARAGAELRLSPPDGTRHALVVALEGGRFSAWGLDTAFLFQGVQLDLASVRAAWRLYPWRGHGLYVDGGSGFLVARDRIALVMPDREVRSTEVRLGVPFELSTGWMVADHVDVALRYTQIVFTAKAPATLGFLQLALGVRL